jgi:hypothetical protein
MADVSILDSIAREESDRSAIVLLHSASGKFQAQSMNSILPG